MTSNLVSITDNPVATNAYKFATELPSENWQHQITASHGFHSASFVHHSDQTRLEELFGILLGRTVTRYSGDGGKIVWEGFINSLQLNLPGISYSISLDNMANRIRTRYTPIDNTTTPPETTGSTTRTATASDASSIAQYGTKDLVLSAGETTSTIAAQVRDVALGLYKQPRRSATINSSGRDVSLNVGCKGFVHTLDWPVYNQTVLTGTQNANLQISDLITAGGAFIARKVLSTNTSAIPKYTDFDRTILSQVQAIANIGDASGNRWVAPVLEGRTLYYRQASETIEYVRRTKDSNQFIESLTGGGMIPYELVRPDAWIRTTDIMLHQTGGLPFTSKTEDYQLMYIESVSWSEPDSLTIAGSVGDSVQTMIARQSALGERVL